MTRERRRKRSRPPGSSIGTCSTTVQPKTTLPNFLRISMNNQQQPSLQRHLSVSLCKNITHASWLAEVEGFSMQWVVEALGSHYGGITCQWEQRKQIVNLPFDTRPSWPAQEPADRRAINKPDGDRLEARKQQNIRHGMIEARPA